MNVKVRTTNKDGSVRLETSGAIKEVLINEDMLHPDNESISIYFSGSGSSGILDFSPREIEQLMTSVKNRMHLIKGIKILK